MQNPKSPKEAFKEEFEKRIYIFILKLIEFIDSLPNDRVTNIISNQLIRSGTSIGGNYFEAKGASSKRDFSNFFSHCLKSANETKFWLSLLIDAKRCNIQKANELLKEVSEIANIFASSILTMKGRK